MLLNRAFVNHKTFIMSENPNFFKRHAAIVKALVVSVIILLLLVPANMIRFLIYEREGRQQEAIMEVSNKWSNSQTISGPILSIPYESIERTTNVDGKISEYKTMHFLHVLPEELELNGAIDPEMKKRGMYEVALYTSSFDINGKFVLPSFEEQGIDKKLVKWDLAKLTIGISDLRGISERLAINAGDEEFLLEPGSACQQILNSGVYTPINIDSKTEDIAFTFPLELKGSQYVFFHPVGKETLVNLNSNWPDPKFTGAFLPKHETSDAGFTANWKVLNLNRNYPQFWKDDSYDLRGSEFGVELLIPVDSYQKTERTIKYALLILALTFMVFYFLEILYKENVHPIQYLLIGFAICLFYALLLSFSEHIGFRNSYAISSIMTIGLVVVYARYVLKNKRNALLLGSILIFVYAFIYFILQLQDFALLVGTLGLFFILAIVMYITRNVDWQLPVKSK